MARPPRPPLLGGGIGRGDVGGGGGRFSGGGIVGRNAVLDLVEGGHRAGVGLGFMIGSLASGLFRTLLLLACSKLVLLYSL